jgi:O-antigen biosynthesis protein
MAFMEILFTEYELLTASDLFDATYYLNANPDIAALNMDPLLHYLEWGCRERRDPSASFDTAYYLKQCKALGEAPQNALAHYLTIGARRGLRPRLQGAIGSALHSDNAHCAELVRPVLCVDIPRIVAGAAEVSWDAGVSIVGWGVAPDGVATVEVAVDGKRAVNARYGLRRPDVAAVHPDWTSAMLSGYAAHLPPQALDAGSHRVAVSLRDRKGGVVATEFRIEVEEMADGSGPRALRRKMTQAEIDFQLDGLTQQRWYPHFRVLLPLPRTKASLRGARCTLSSLGRQTYPNWELCLMAAMRNGRSRRGRCRGAVPLQLIEGFEDLAGRVTMLAHEPASGAADQPCFFARLAPGDELGCDAFLEVAVASSLARQVEFFYFDERRSSPVTGKVDAFFKPGWSPDLLLSTNYIGRAWCAGGSLIKRAGLGLAQFGVLGDYDMTLRLTEKARTIEHVPRLLHQRADISVDTVAQERGALRAALRRRKIAAEVRADTVAGHYRVKRPPDPGRVAIIIPTCAAEGRIRTCLETLRAHTARRAYEVVCIENIPEDRRHWKRWLRSHADLVIETDTAFNWSRYNNIAAAGVKADYLLFLNDDVEIIEPDWLDALVEQAQRSEIGVVGPLLLYPDRTVQHAGVMLDEVGRGRHAFRHLPENDAGYFGLALTQRNVISVTGACLMTRREMFESIGGFDEAHAVINNDLDYCLRVRRKGLLTVYTPHARLIHHELASRGGLPEEYDAEGFAARWHEVIALGDPYFNPNLSRSHEPFTIEREPVETIHAGHPLFTRASVRRILVVKLDHIGDCIIALPALRRLKQHFPEARISVLAGHATLPIWKVERSVAEVIELNFFHARSGLGTIEVTPPVRQATRQSLHARKFDLAIDLRKQPDTREMLQLSGATLLAGFDHQGRFPWLDVALEWDEDVPLRPKHGHVADDLVALVEAVVAHSESDRLGSMKTPEGALPLAPAERRRLFSRPLICIHPAAGSPMRQWPAAHFSQLVHLLLQHEHSNVALIGTADDKELASQVLLRVEQSPRVFDFVGRLTLAQLPQLLAGAALFVGSNSGPQHLAAALGVATVGIHSGVVDAREWGPVGARAIALRRRMSCSPCYIERAADCPRALACLTDLGVAQVYRTCRRMLRRPHESMRSSPLCPKPPGASP